MKLQTNLVLLLGLSMCCSVFAQSNLIAYKRSISSAPFEQVFELGLKGVGSCKIVPAFLKGIRTWRVTTTKPRPGIMGDGVLLGLEEGTLRVAHGFAWTPEFHTSLALPNRFFKPAWYSSFKNSDSRQNAVLMLRKAVADDLCNLTSSSLPEAQSVNISEFTAEKIKQSFTFYVDSSRKISCTSSLHSKPVFNPATCRYESKKIAIGASACKRAYQKASVSGRATVTTKNDKSKKPKFFFPPVLEALTPEIEREMLISELPFETHVMAAHASEKLDIQAVIDPSLVPVKANLSELAEREIASRFKYSFEEAKGDYIKPSWLSSVYDEIKMDTRLSALNPDQAISDRPIEADVINSTKFQFLEPIKPYFPKLHLAASGCQLIEHFEMRNFDDSTMRAE